MDGPASTEPASSYAFKAHKSVSITIPSSDTTTPSSNQHDATLHDSDTMTTASNDPVVWPINRCCYEELKPNDLLTVEQLFTSRDDTPSFMKWIVVHKAPRTFQKRLLVVSSFRLWILKRSQTPFKGSLVVSKEYQLLHLDEINVLRLTTLQLSDPTALSTSIKLLFHPPNKHHNQSCSNPTSQEESNQASDAGRHHKHELHLDPGVNAESLVRLLQRGLHEMRLVFPSQQLPRLRLPSQCHWQEFFTMSALTSSPAHGGAAAYRKAWSDVMTTAYRCFCDDLDVPYRASVTSRLRECLESACVDFPYCLSAATSSSMLSQSPVIPSHGHASSSHSGVASVVGFFARLIGLSSSASHAKEVQALARTLEHCHCFEDIIVYDLPVSDGALSSLFQALLSSPTQSRTPSALKGFSLTNVDLSKKALWTLQHIVLQSSISKSTQHSQQASAPVLQLRRLDLSFNRFSVMMAHGLATILDLLPSGLEILQLEQCHLSTLSSSRILSAMKSSHGFSSCLRELNLSGNRLSGEGTRMLAMWITGAFALRRLDLSRTKLQTNMFFQSFKQNTILHESSLVTLDLSYNRMGTQASYDLGDILGKTQSLSTILLRGMKQSLLHPRRILNGILVAHGRRQRGKTKKNKQIQVQAQVRQSCNGLRKIHLQNILGPMFQNSSRALPCMIDLSENNLHGPKATVLAHLIDSAPNVSHASLRLDYANLTDKAAVLLLHSLRGCKTLDSLSLEGNGLVKRQTKKSYKRFHSARNKAAAEVSPPVPTIVEQAAGDALSLLLGGKTAAQSSGTNSDASSGDSGHSFTHLYHHRPKKLPLKELSLKAQGKFVFGSHVLTMAVQALEVNTSLQMLDVSGNECGDALAKALGTVLPVNKSLHVLYWDDNFTTVDGFFAFYDGLLRNQTLSVVQLPINDTRRILEEQKDPPREKLFSVLGKIFKVTERNQTIAMAAKDHRHNQPHQLTKKHSSLSTTTTTAVAADEKHDGQKKQQRQRTPKSSRADPEAHKLEPEEVDVDHIKPTLPSQSLFTSNNHADAVPQTAVDQQAKEASWAENYYYQSGTTTRYPTTIKNWSAAVQTGNSSLDREDDLRASWDQIGKLASMLT